MYCLKQTGVDAAMRQKRNTVLDVATGAQRRRM